MAMKESGSRDWFLLARIGLEAAIPSDVELLALLEASSRPPKSAPARPAEMAVQAALG